MVLTRVAGAGMVVTVAVVVVGAGLAAGTLFSKEVPAGTSDETAADAGF